MIRVAVTLDGQPFDEEAVGTDEFYARLRAGAVAATSHPNPTHFASAYTRAASKGAGSVVSIHLDARASGTIASAEAAARDAPTPVLVVDTNTASFGVAACVRAAREAEAAGGSAESVARAASQLGRRLENAFVARTGPGGRILSELGWALLRFADGTTTPITGCQSIDQAVAEMAQLVIDSGPEVAAAVGHAGAEMETAADALAHTILGAERAPTVERYRVGASVGAHTGAESLGVFWWSRE